jgi:hypothetical protein
MLGNGRRDRFLSLLAEVIETLAALLLFFGPTARS